MLRPLYQPLANDTNLRTAFQRFGGNAGLWYDKFCDQWRRNPRKQGPLDWSLETFESQNERGQKAIVNPKTAWIETVAGTIGDRTQLDELQRRRAQLLETGGGTALLFNTAGPFATGLGRAHPVENGFAWHHTLGVPYLPGSSVKGLVRAYVEYWADDEAEWKANPEQKKADIQRIFGPRGDDAHAIGSVIFLDALPTGPARLKADVMTPHYGPYYQDSTGQTPPADWHSPVPIPFLVVAPGNTFQFGLLPRRQDYRDDCRKVAEWLEQALHWLGAGAKTAVGYGRMAKEGSGAGRSGQAQPPEGPQPALWPKATIRYDAGRAELSATLDGKTALRKDAKALFEALGSNSRKEKAKKGQLSADVKVLLHPDGHIELLEMVPPA
ncbi:type III-B CRISPR module RAMP protein Cmr6 [Candidatus Methylocalor cossyra]|uniref:CRISPR type III-associated protein domain-containing protein n=1 Tax=Candidatus Methylocalor cossyra TaxID=3108543 RepID=A0ABM9NKB0_9GAMM